VDRRSIGLFAVTILGLAVGLLCLASRHFGDDPQLQYVMYGLVGITGFARGFYGPAIFGMVSDIVPRRLYGNAAAYNSATFQGSAMAGPILGGILYNMIKASNTYAVSTVLLFCAFCLFLRVSSRSEKPEKKQDVSVVENIKEGLRFVFSQQIVLGAMAMDLFAVLFGGTVAMLPIFAKEIFHMGPEALGALRAAPSIGALVSATLLTKFPITHNTGRVFMAVVAGFGICMIGFGLSTNFYLSLVLLGISGALDGVSVWVRSTIYQLITPNDMKGRIAAVNSMFIGSSNEIGEFESGVTAKFMGLIPSVIFGGCMTLLVVLFTSVKAPKLRDLQMHELYQTEEV
jgi:MFS family permease